MEIRERFEKRLCMTELQVERYETTEVRRVELPEERMDARFLYIFSGEAVFQSPHLHLSAGTGDLVYLPESIGEGGCHIFWNGASGISYIALRIVSKRIDMANNDRYTVQRVAELSVPETGETFRTIFCLFQTENKSPEKLRIDRVRAIGLYYAFYADVLPCLTAAPPVQYNESLLDAVAYIDTHLSEDFDMELLAQSVCVSTSHLYHLFRDELGISPVQYRNERRIERAAQDLRFREESIEKIAVKNGFHSAIYFHRMFKAATGLTPGEYREAIIGQVK